MAGVRAGNATFATGPAEGAERGVKTGRSALFSHMERRQTGNIARQSGAGGRIGRSCRSERDDGPFLIPVLGHRELFAVSGNRDQRVAAIAGEQRSRVNRRQLLAAAITDHQIRTMLGSGWLDPRFPGVYVVGYGPDSDLTRETEALLACAPGALLGGVSCGVAWNFIPWHLARHEVHITVQGERRSRHPGIRTHRTESLDAKRDVRIHNGLPTVSPARALVEMACMLTARELERGLDDALNSNIVRLAQVREALTRIGPCRKGAPLLHALLTEREDGSGLSRSDGEIALSEALLGSGLPRPVRNYQLIDYEVDFCWPELKVIVEVDSYRWHLRKASFDSDRAEDAALEARGYTVLRFTAKQIADEPLVVIAQIAAALTWAAARASRGA
jgi:very-short-patch-repair endonuclease